MERTDPRAACRLGKELFFGSNDDATREKGLYYLQTALRGGDAEAACLLGGLLLDGTVEWCLGESEPYGRELLYRALSAGWFPARETLTRCCGAIYGKTFPPAPQGTPLRDPCGKPVVLKRCGRFDPVRATLIEDGAGYLLRLETCLSFVDGGDQTFRRAVRAGVKDWEGTYQVFGCPLRVEVTLLSRGMSTVRVVAADNALYGKVENFFEKVGTEKMKKRVRSTLGRRTSLAAMGVRRWSVRSRKMMIIQTEDRSFEGLRGDVRHEFGHVLGLGDLYADRTQGLAGVPHGTYGELDCYHLRRRAYFRVMCDSRAPVCGNDIEMVLLAFRDDCKQDFQFCPGKGHLSKALGRNET